MNTNFLSDSIVLNGKYQLSRVLRKMKNSQVLECNVIDESKRVAIKMLSRPFHEIGIQEIEMTKLVSSLRQSLMVQFVDDFIIDGSVCIVIELLGSSLLERLRVKPPCGIAEIQGLGERVFETLDLLSKHNIVHADLKPENILYDLDLDPKKVKLVDYGNSILTRNVNIYEDDFAIQSMRYRAPEVVFGLEISCAIDIWSFGVCLIEACVGFNIFTATTPKELIEQWVQFFGDSCEFGNFSSGRFFPRFRDSLLKRDILRASQSKDDNESLLEAHLSTRNIKSVLLSSFPSIMNHNDDLCDLISRCLNMNPRNRITAEQALNHPFFKRTRSVTA